MRRMKEDIPGGGGGGEARIYLELLVLLIKLKYAGKPDIQCVRISLKYFVIKEEAYFISLYFLR